MRTFTLEYHADNDDAPRIIGTDGGTWNGFAIVLATEEAIRGYLQALRNNDPNGTYPKDADVHSNEYAVMFHWSDEDESYDPETFARVGTDSNGMPLYSLVGWTMVKVDDEHDPMAWA